MMKAFVGGGQWGSEAKGAFAGWLAYHEGFTAAVAAFPPSTGHTFYHPDGRRVMTCALPISAAAPATRDVFIGPGALFYPAQLAQEWQDFAPHTRLFIHEAAVPVLAVDAEAERAEGLTRVGSTVKGGAAAQWRRMARGAAPVIARDALDTGPLRGCRVTAQHYLELLTKHERVCVEGSQGFGLSLYHGTYPFVCARDTTPAAVYADCGIPSSWIPEFKQYWVLRTYPIRVNNRDGSSGPCYPDSAETSFDKIGQPVELTTVTRLPRRIFTWSDRQLVHLRDQCFTPGARVHLSFADYLLPEEVNARIAAINYLCGSGAVCSTGWGPKFDDIIAEAGQ